MKDFLKRDKFKTETGKQLFDVLINIAPNLDELYMLFAMVRGDKDRKTLLDYIRSGHNNWEEIDDYIVETWG